MDTLIGKTLSHYRIERELARGGMGIVYLAHDTRLNRPAAIKALPDDMVADRDRLARFKQEAQVLASLSHPNIAAIYGLEESGDRRYIAMEYVDGETLAQRIARGPLPINETVDICLQIAAGMEAAHEGGIIHRDLKPGNVMITPGDVVKVLDFGLAKVRAATGASPTSESSPTVTDSPATMPGVILGTAAYLSPEQARGKAVDRRTDIWSFGCVLYECLTGGQAFEGESVSDVISRILSSEPDWSQLPTSIPPTIRGLLERCLEKDPRERLRDMGDARLALEEVLRGKSEHVATPPTPAVSPRAIAFAVVLAVLSAAAGIAAWSSLGPGHEASSAARAVKRVSINLPPELQSWGVMGRISPDGKHLIAWARPRPKEGEQPAPGRIYWRRIDSYHWEAVPGSEGVQTNAFSPDGRWFYFLARLSERASELHLMKTRLDGGAAPISVADWDSSWAFMIAPLSNGDVLVANWKGDAYVTLPANGGTPSPPIKIEAGGYTGAYQFWSVLPGDRGVLANTFSYGAGGFLQGTAIVDPRTGRARILLQDGGYAAYAPTGHLIFSRRSTLLAVPFDLKRGEVDGEPVPIINGLYTGGSWANAFFWISGDGALVYRPGEAVWARRRLIVVDGQGHTSEWTHQEAEFQLGPRISPDGTKILCEATNAKGINEIWLSERSGASPRRIVAVPNADCEAPVWSPDGRQIAYSRRGNDRMDGIYAQALAGGTPRRIVRADSSGGYWPTSWSPNGADILADADQDPGLMSSVIRARVRPNGDSVSPPARLIPGPENQGSARFSPDGRWVAYTSNQSGTSQVYVAPYRQDGSLGSPMVVSEGGGVQPCWSRSGREVFYATGGGSMKSRRVMSVRLSFEPALSSAPPVRRWDVDPRWEVDEGFDLLPGDELVTVQRGEKEEEDQEATRMDVVLNFFEELRQKLRAAGKH